MTKPIEVIEKNKFFCVNRSNVNRGGINRRCRDKSTLHIDKALMEGTSFPGGILLVLECDKRHAKRYSKDNQSVCLD